MGQRAHDARALTKGAARAAAAEANEAFLRFSRTPSPFWLAERRPKQEELFRGSLAGKPATALPGIDRAAGESLQLNGVHTVRERSSSFFLFLPGHPFAITITNLFVRLHRDHN